MFNPRFKFLVCLLFNSTFETKKHWLNKNACVNIALIKALHRQSKELTNIWHLSTEKPRHNDSATFHNSCSFFGYAVKTAPLMSVHPFSMGLRSVGWAGQSITSMPLLVNHDLAVLLVCVGHIPIGVWFITFSKIWTYRYGHPCFPLSKGPVP